MIKSISRLFVDFEKYATGYKPIDDEHIAILYHLLRIQDQINPTEEIRILTDLVFKHFSFEEAIMDQVNYPLKDLHRAVHTSYLQKFQQALILGSDVTVTDLIADTLNHFIWHDKLLVDYIKENNIKNVEVDKVGMPVS